MLCNMHTTNSGRHIVKVAWWPVAALSKSQCFGPTVVSVPALIRVAISSSIPPRKTVWVQPILFHAQECMGTGNERNALCTRHWLWLCALHSHLLLHNRLFLVYIICEGFQCPRAALCVYSWAWLMPSIHCLTTCSFMCRITCTQKMAYTFHPSVHPQSVLPSQFVWVLQVLHRYRQHLKKVRVLLFTSRASLCMTSLIPRPRGRR